MQYIYIMWQSYFCLRLFDLGWWIIIGFPNRPQRPQPASFGEGGSRVGGSTLTVDRYAACPLPPVDRLRSNIPTDPTLRDGLRSLNSTISLSSRLRFVLLKSPDRNLSFQTKPDDPCLLKDIVDLCNPAISLPLEGWSVGRKYELQVALYINGVRLFLVYYKCTGRRENDKWRIKGKRRKVVYTIYEVARMTN